MRCPPLILAEEAFRDLTIGAIIIQVHIYDKYTTLAYRLPYYTFRVTISQDIRTWELQVKVVIKPISGDAQAYIERAKEELTKVLDFLIVESTHISSHPVKPWWEKRVYIYSRRMNLTNEAEYVINNIRSQEVLPNPGSGGAP
jgi:hypothetical protein